MRLVRAEQEHGDYECRVYRDLDQTDLEVRGQRVHVVDTGRGPTVLMVHGSPVSSFCFRHQINALRHSFRVVAPDLLGFGRSSAPPGGTGFVAQSQMLAALMDRLGVDDLRLVVHDWGGPAGLASLTLSPRRLQQLVLINTSILADFTPPLYWRSLLKGRVGEALVVRLNLTARLLPLLLRTAKHKRVREVYALPLERSETRRTVLALERLSGFPESAQAACGHFDGVALPTLLLWGDPDPYFRDSELRRMRGLFPRALLRRIAGGGHFPQEDASSQVTDALSEFLR